MGSKNAKESDSDDSDDEMDNDEEEDDEGKKNRILFFFLELFLNFFFFAEEEDIPLDLEEIEAVSKKARQDEEIHSEHMQVLQDLTNSVTNAKIYSLGLVKNRETN